MASETAVAIEHVRAFIMCEYLFQFFFASFFILSVSSHSTQTIPFCGGSQSIHTHTHIQQNDDGITASVAADDWRK